MLYRKWLIVFALLILCIGLGITQASAAAPFVPIYTLNNNFTMLDPSGTPVGGSNDVTFTWDGTLKTAVAASLQVSNATLASSCMFNGFTWKAHDVAVYGPGTYTVKASCAPKAPGCATGTNPITFTVGPDEIGAHMLFDWGTLSTNKNIDVVNVWKKSSVFTPSAMITGVCGSNSAGTIWDLMSKDPGTGINGYAMVDGGFIGFRANFNVMGTAINRSVDTANNNFTMDQPDAVAFGGTNDVRFTWDGTKKTAVAASGQVSNASLSSPCAFFGQPWWAHDMVIYGPGTYSVYTDCPAGSPGCGYGVAYTFTVKTGELGVHTLFYWNGNEGIDVVNVWKPGSFDQGVNPSLCLPAEYWTGACGTGDAAAIWDHMSYDWDGDCVNGAGMVDGPFLGMNANFNTMGNPPPDPCLDAATRCNDGNLCTTDTCNTATGACINTPVVCNDNNFCTTDTCNTTTGACEYAAKNCDDNNACTTDSCNSTTGACVNTAMVCNDNNNCTTDTCVAGVCQYVANTVTCPATSGNNFTMIDPGNNQAGGTNDVVFAWDGTKKTSVATSGQVINATITSTCPFFGVPWTAHDVAIYGPGTYTVFSGCEAGSPGCGTGAPINFTVKTGEIGVHMLFDWGPSTNIDVVNVLKPNAVSSNMWTGACGSNPVCTVWKWASYDFDADGINGTPMVDGPFLGMNANFNMGNGTVNLCCDSAVRCNDNNVCTTDSCNTATGACVNTAIVCNDNNACTTDSCNAATGCVYTPIVCNDNNACTTDACTAGTCVYTPKSCNDNNACTADSCNTTTGACVNTATVCTIAGQTCDPADGVCKFCTTNAQCNDNNICTTDTCVSGTCSYVANTTICPVSSGNNFTMIDPGNNAFGGTNDVSFAWDGTKKTAVAASGQVANAVISSSCAFFGVTWAAHDVTVYGPGTYTIYAACAAGKPGCGDASAGTIPFTVKTGEIGVHMLFDWNGYIDIDVVNVMKPNAASSNMWTGACGSNSSCTTWSWASYDFNADGINGFPMVDGPFVGNNATFNLVKGTVNLCCDAATRCNDNNACTTDTCNTATGACVNTTIVCNDNNACTTDTCNTATGCVFTAKNCNDNNACTTDSCNTTTGACVNTTIVCNDNNACTADACNPASGCVFQPIICNDNNACTTDTCNAVTGCVFTAKNCNDNNVCTNDSCNSTTGACVNTAIVCTDNNLCTTDTCNTSTGCVYTPVVCNDNNACTTDACNTATGACVYTNKNCNDNNACTADSCNTATGACINTMKSCSDFDACTIDACDPLTGACSNTALVCDDSNTCTADTCNSATGCVYTALANATPCTLNSQPGTCTAGVCIPVQTCNGVKSVTIRGGGGNATMDLQIMTSFTVMNAGGCILASTASSVTVSPGTSLQIDCKKGTGPQPSSGTWLGATISTDVPFSIVAPTTIGDIGKLILSNRANGGKDSDKMTITVQ